MIKKVLQRALAVAVLLSASASVCAETLSGTVFHDLNGDGQRQSGEPGIPHVLVSNGLDVVRTVEDGTWQLPVRDDMDVTVIQPTGWRVPVDDRQVPQFAFSYKLAVSSAVRSSVTARLTSISRSITSAPARSPICSTRV